MFIKPPQSAFGLDIGNLSLKLFQFQKRGTKTSVSAFNKIDLPAGYIENGEIINLAGILNIIEKLIKEVPNKINTNEVITSIPESKTFIKVIAIPSLPEKELTQTVIKEMEQHLPLSPEEIYFDWQIIGKNEGQLKILFGAAPRSTIDKYTELLEKAGLLPIALEPESAAIIRSLIPEKTKTPMAIIDIGATQTTFIIYDQETIQFTTSLPISGNKITETIIKTLKLTPGQAEKAKITCGLDKQKCRGALREILFSSVEELVTRIKESLAFYQDNSPNRQPVKKIMLSGGGANFIGINEFLSQRLNLPTESGNPWTNINSEKPLPEEQLLTYTTAVGLALRGSQEI